MRNWEALGSLTTNFCEESMPRQCIGVRYVLWHGICYCLVVMDLAVGGRVFRGFPRRAERCLCKKLHDEQNAAEVALSVKIGKREGLRMDGK